MRHLFSVLIALIGSAVGLLLLWFAAGWIARLSMLVFTPRGEAIAGYLALVAGVLLLAASIAVATALSSAGAIVVGAWHLLGGLLALLWPFDPMRDVESPVWTVIIWFSSIWRETGDGALYFVATGMGLTAGAVLLAAGIASLGRRTGSGAGRVVAIAAGIVLLVAAVGLTVWFGGQAFREFFLYFRPEAGTIALLVLAAALGAAGAVSARWSAVPTLVAGAVSTLAGILFVALPPHLLFMPGSPGGTDLLSTGATGLVLGLGAVVLALGVGLALRARVAAAAARRAAEPPTPAPGIPAAGPGAGIG